MSNSEPNLINFSDFSLAKPIQDAIQNIGYETPSPIQAQTIPHLLKGKDILGVAQTGTGKTAAFALPLLSNLNLKTKTPQILCLAPTRELAIQVAEAFKSYAKFLNGFTVLPIYGGADYRSQIRQLERGVHVVVGTPGRVMDHMRRGTLKLKDLKALVLDEADEMLNMGFIEDIEWILQQVPPKHQTALFSATMPPQIRNITKQYLQDPVEITIKVKTTTAPSIHQSFIQVRGTDKLDMLTRVMEVEKFDALIVFVRTKNLTLEVTERLQARGFAAEALNGDIKQEQREKTVNRLKKGQIDIVVATDVAARGLDVERITHVVNFDIPYDPEAYVHRVGRTGRAGREGSAILFVTGRESKLLHAIERTTRKEITPYEFPTMDELNERKIKQFFGKIDAALQQDLSELMEVLTRYQQMHNADPLLIAAALASLESGSASFYVKKAPPVISNKRPVEDRSQQRANRKRGRFNSKAKPAHNNRSRKPAHNNSDPKFGRRKPTRARHSAK